MSPIIIIHLSLMSTMLIVLVIGAIIAKKRGTKWFIKHKRFMGVGIFAGVAGFLTLFTEKIIENESHFVTLHSKLGAVGLLLLIVAATLGVKFRTLPKSFKISHRTTAAIALILVLVSVTTGYLLVFG